MTCSYPSIPHDKETFLQMQSCPFVPKASLHAPCSPLGCHLCLQCCPRPLGLTECLPHLLLVILAGCPLLLPLSLFLLVLGIPQLSPGLQPCRSLRIIIFCSRLHFFMLSLHGDLLSFFLLDSVQCPFSQIPIPNPSSSQHSWVCLFVQSSPFPTCLCRRCSLCLSQDGACGVAGAG